MVFKSRLPVFVLSLMLGTASFAESTENSNVWYVTAKGAVTSKSNYKFTLRSAEHNVAYKTGFDTSVAAGKEVGDIWRIELEAGMTCNQVESITVPGYHIYTAGKSRAGYALFNTYIDFNRKGNWVPYIGTGLGTAYVNGYAPTFYGNYVTEGVALAYQASAGIRAKVNENIELGFGARYLGWAAESNADNGQLLSGAFTFTYRFV